MKKISSILISIFIISMFSVTAFGIDKASLLQQKMTAKGKTAGTAKLITQYQAKFKQLMGKIQYQYTVLDGVVKQSQNLSEDDKSTLLDILENDPDYSLANVQSTYNTMMNSLPKTDVQALTKMLQSQYKAFSDILDNLNSYAVDLPQYYIYGDNAQVSKGDEGNNNNEKNSSTLDGNKSNIDANNAINIKTDKPLTLEQMQYILNKIKPGQFVTINGQNINYDKIKTEVQKMLSQKQENSQTEGSLQITTTDSAIQRK